MQSFPGRLLFFGYLITPILLADLIHSLGAPSVAFTHNYLLDLAHSSSVVMLVGGIISRAGYASGYIRGAVLHAYLAKKEVNLPCPRLTD
jgi:hypothetical protein